MSTGAPPPATPPMGPPPMAPPPPGSGRDRHTLVLIGVSLVVILMVVAIVTVVLLRHEGSGREWNTVVGVDADAGELILFDPDGSESDRIDTGIAELGPVSVRDRYAIVNDSDQETAAIIDLTDGSDVWRDDSGEDAVLSWLPGTDSPIAAAGSTYGGEVTIVDAGSGEAIEVGEAAGLDEPRLLSVGAITSPDGEHVALSDAVSREAVLVNVRDGTAAAFPGTAADLSDDTLAVVDPTQGDAEVRFVATDDASETGSAALPDAPLGVMLTGTEDAVGAAIAEDRDGAITFSVSAGDSEPTELAEVDAEEPGVLQPYPAAGRMTLRSQDETILLDTEGEEVARVDGMGYAVERNGKCLLTTDDDTLRLSDLESGDEVAATEGHMPGAAVSSYDGCAVVSQGALLSESLTAESTDDELWTAVAPDGSAAIAIRDDEDWEVVDLDDPDADPVEFHDVVFGFATR